MREYVVVKDPTFSEVEVVEASYAGQAIRKVVEEQGDGTYWAFPVRNMHIERAERPDAPPPVVFTETDPATWLEQVAVARHHATPAEIVPDSRKAPERVTTPPAA